MGKTPTVQPVTKSPIATPSVRGARLIENTGPDKIQAGFAAAERAVGELQIAGQMDRAGVADERGNDVTHSFGGDLEHAVFWASRKWGC